MLLNTLHKVGQTLQYRYQLALFLCTQTKLVVIYPGFFSTPTLVNSDFYIVRFPRYLSKKTIFGALNHDTKALYH